MERTGRCSTCTLPKCPFISIVTRCYKRPKFLAHNRKSLKAQTDQDYEQVFIIDPIGYGLAAADQALGKYKDANCGDYVMVLDDDDYIIDNDFIRKVKNVAKKESPDLIIWRGKFFNNKIVLPPHPHKLWGVRPIKCAIGSFSYCMTNKLYSKYVDICKTGSTGDFDFINAVYHGEDKPKTVWMTDVFMGCQGTANKGKPEGDLKKGTVLIAPNGKQRRVIRSRR